MVEGVGKRLAYKSAYILSLVEEPVHFNMLSKYALVDICFFTSESYLN